MQENLPLILLLLLFQKNIDLYKSKGILYVRFFQNMSISIVKNPKNKLGAKLRAYREKEKLSQRQLSKRLGYTNSGLLSRIESSKDFVSIDQAVKILCLGYDLTQQEANFLIAQWTKEHAQEEFERVLAKASNKKDQKEIYKRLAALSPEEQEKTSEILALILAD